MAQFNIWLLLMPFIVVSLIFGVGIFFVRKKYRLWFARFRHLERALDIIMLTKNRNVYHGVIPITSEKFNYKGEEYIIDEEAIYTEKFRLAQRPYSFYLEGNPKPIKFDFTSNKAIISSKDLDALNKSKLIQQLLETREEKMTLIILILQFALLAGLGILAFLLIGKMNNLTEILTKISQVMLR